MFSFTSNYKLCACFNKVNLIEAMLFLQAVAESSRIDELFIAKSLFVLPAPIEEDDVVDDPFSSVLNVIECTSDQRVNSVIQVEIVAASTKRGRPKIIDQDGYTYNLCHTWNSRKSVWRCSVRGKIFLVVRRFSKLARHLSED